MFFQRTRQTRVFSTIVHYSNFAVKQEQYKDTLKVKDFKFGKVNWVYFLGRKKYWNYFQLENLRIPKYYKTGTSEDSMRVTKIMMACFQTRSGGAPAFGTNLKNVSPFGGG